MFTKIPPTGSRAVGAFELLPREASLDLRNSSTSSRHSGADDDDRQSTHLQRRQRLNAGHGYGRGSGSRSRPTFAKRFGLSSELAAALELVTQSTPSLLCAVVGSVIMGVVFDKVQFWPAFVKIEELFILVPVLLNLKGCLEMNLASRLSTSANIGELDIRKARYSIVTGNLALLQVQALLIGALAGLLSFVLGYITRPHRETWFESALMIVSAMLSASLSSIVLSTFMSSLVSVSRRFRINPDNIATPLAASFSDLLSIIILTFLTSFLVNVIKTYWATAILILLSLALPGFILLVWRNPYVSELLFEGWTATIVSMVISSGVGVLLQRYVDEYDALPLILPVTMSLSGNVGCIFASRLSTEFHAKTSKTSDLASMTSRDNIIVMATLFTISMPIFLAFLGVIYFLGIFKFSALFMITFLITGALSILASLTLAYVISKVCWKRGYNPDNFVMGLIAAIVDVVVAILLVLVFKISV